MWIFTKYGFYSVTKSPVEKGKMQIRARTREDLENIQIFFQDKLRTGAPVIIETNSADYRWRVVVSRSDWVKLAAELARDVEYENFKNTIADRRRHDLYLRVWGVMRGLQTNPEERRQTSLWDMWDNSSDDPEEINDDDDGSGFSELMTEIEAENRLGDTGFQIVDEPDYPLEDD